MKHLYTSAEEQRWRRRANSVKYTCAALSVLALIVCIILCTQVSTANAQTLRIGAIAIFTLAGWTDILLLWFVYWPAKAQAVHISGVRTGEMQCQEGVLKLQEGAFQIPGSIMVRRAALQTDEGVVSLHVSAALAKQLPSGGERLRVWTVHRFITAYEVIA